MKVLLVLTGSVATTVVYKLIEGLLKNKNEVKVVFTQSAEYFCQEFSLRKMFEQQPVKFYYDRDEWPNSNYEKDQKIPHIDLADWADVLLIAPLSANTLGKMANGICDNLATCIARAWHLARPVIIAPAMNTRMWEHPVTAVHLQQLAVWYNLIVIDPIEKKLACGDFGIGAMAKVQDIVGVIENLKKGGTP